MFYPTRFISYPLPFAVACLFCLLAVNVPAGAAEEVTLAWDESADSGVAGYMLYYGNQSGDYTAAADAGDLTRYTVSGLEQGASYYFAVTAYTAEGVESDFSNEVSYSSPEDYDEDGIPDSLDVCPEAYNPEQIDTDGDGMGDVCDSDDDGDGVGDDADVCPAAYDPEQTDSDGDGAGDACDEDADGDWVADAEDNCPGLYNPDQEDLDGDMIGDLCDSDTDGDGIDNDLDNCAGSVNYDQSDIDGDGMGDVCDGDDDGDGVGDDADVCPAAYDPEQTDSDGDGAGDACDEDADGDWVADAEDNCPGLYNPEQIDADGDGIGDECDDSIDIDEPPVIFVDPVRYFPRGDSETVPLSISPACPTDLDENALVVWMFTDDCLSCSELPANQWYYRKTGSAEWISMSAYSIYIWALALTPPFPSTVIGPGTFELKVSVTDCAGQKTFSDVYFIEVQ